jgi:hypothetical protein
MNTVDIAKVFGISALGLLVTALLVTTGCSKRSDGPRHKSIEGKVTEIDTASDEVGMLWYNPKERREQHIRGTLATDAEILIDGRTAKLDDVLIDDVVSVTGRIEKHNGEPKLVAVKVHITRNNRTDSLDAPPPATQPQL